MAKRVRTPSGTRCQSAKGKFIKNSACSLSKSGGKKKKASKKKTHGKCLKKYRSGPKAGKCKAFAKK